MTDYQVPMFERLEPRTPFKGGRITDTDVLTLSEAARFASVHAGTEITPADILRAGARGEITLSAIVHQRAKVQTPGGGVCINEGHPTDENVIPKGAIPTLPLKACKQLAAAGHASWRTLDGFKNVEGELCRYTKFRLTDDEPDFVTTPDDCRLTGYNVHALADAFIDEPAPATDTAKPAPLLPTGASDGMKPAKAGPVANASKKPPTNWRHKIQAAAYEHWISLRAVGANPTRHSILGDMARWCQENDVKTDTGIYPRASYIKNVALNGSWQEPFHSIEQAKVHIAKLK